MTVKKVTHKKVEKTTPEEIENHNDIAATVTVAEKGHSMKHENKGHHVVATVNVPAHTAEVTIARSLIEGCAAAAVEAWDTVKGKDDASFAASSDSFKRDLLYAAEGVYKSGTVLEGDSSLARFEQEVARIKKEQDDAKKKATAKAA